MPTKYTKRNSEYRSQPKSGKKKAKRGDAGLNLSSMLPLFSDEDKAREFLENKRWPDGNAYCPHCGEGDAYRLTAKPDSKRPVRPGVWKCRGRACRKQFTVRIGTIFEESKIPLRKWLMAIHLMTSSKKGVSSHQIAREIDVTQKTAWFLCHRIRESMRQEPMAGMLKGEIEADETYVGGKPRNRQKGRRGHSGRPNPATSNKTPVMVLVERHGRAVSMPVENIKTETLRKEVIKHVDLTAASLNTDELRSYTGIGKDFGEGHEVVKHKDNEYVRITKDGKMVTTNSAESFFALLKRSHYGIHHQMSRKHLGRYCDERSFMWSNRKMSDGERMVAAIEGTEGKRLMYG